MSCRLRYDGKKLVLQGCYIPNQPGGSSIACMIREFNSGIKLSNRISYSEESFRSFRISKSKSGPFKFSPIRTKADSTVVKASYISGSINEALEQARFIEISPDADGNRRFQQVLLDDTKNRDWEYGAMINEMFMNLSSCVSGDRP